MAKATQIEFDSDSHKWFVDVLQTRFSEVLTYREAALDPDRTEGVHDMRVAVRRLRSVIRDFAEISDKFPLKDLRKTLKTLGDWLGAVRDADVLIDVLKKLVEEEDAGQIGSGLETIAAYYENRRSSAFSDLEKKLTDDFLSDLRKSFDDALKTTRRRSDLFENLRVSKAGTGIVSKCLNEFFEASDGIYYPTAVKRLHRLRIAGKHLRYALELFQSVFGAELSPFIDETKNMQSHLGEVHDCDVWIPEIRGFISNSKNGNKHRTAARLISQFTRRRTKAYRQALDLWTDWQSRDFLGKLKAIVGDSYAN